MEAVEAVYLFGKQLGKGSFATVYEGMHRQSRTPVALKVVPKLKVGSAPAIQMLRNEVTSLMRLNHPHIVRLFDVFEDQSKFTLVLELLRVHSVIYLFITFSSPSIRVRNSLMKSLNVASTLNKTLLLSCVKCLMQLHIFTRIMYAIEILNPRTSCQSNEEDVKSSN